MKLLFKDKIRPEFLWVALCGFLCQCSQADKNTFLQGTWKTDSVYSYYNGFGYTRNDIESVPLHHYQPDGNLRMTLGEESRLFSYQITGNDSLIHLNPEKKILEKFLIIKLDHNKMFLKKELRPVFKEPLQERYEIRYFSKVE